jgi:hypothetical protein
MLWKCLAILASLALLVGCGLSAGAMLQPVSGPLFEAHIPSIQVLFSGMGSGAGQIRINMPSGEIVNGQFKTMGGYSSTMGADSEAKPTDPLAVTGADWKALYGASEATAGQINGQIEGTGDMGTILRGEYVMDPVNPRGYGVAKDNKGNLYRIRIHVLVY